jgi:ABC-type phosphate transport system substrate-binding protein
MINLKKTATILLLGGISGLTMGTALADQRVMVVTHPDTPVLNESTLQKIYQGKIVEVNGKSITPINLSLGNAARTSFMQHVMGQDDEKFVAYWTVRRYIGKGAPPREFANVQEALAFLQNTPGAVGYFDESAVHAGLKVVFKKP